MKIFLVWSASIGLFLFHTTIAYCQSGNDPRHVIERMLEKGLIEGHDSKVIGPMGDAASVTLTKVLAARNLRSEDIDTGLWILAQAFADPHMIPNAADREPRTAHLLLRYFEFSTTDPQLKQRIGETGKYIDEKCAAHDEPCRDRSRSSQ